ncbi:hypothetical protein LshimejAT787_0802370 [Lyophyllum shimeji]|uniref:ABC transporter n=1 Tax=Lyophyllum shimeji TaxID=47721 RepID=A0A9P3PS77_LYOSH|nr:hypothetical protein LshimejAT787_0802370 [Lyophyllum shimeji]
MSWLNLDELRLKITIIPQIPELLSGTLRRNLNPFEQYDHAMLIQALRALHLQSYETDAVIQSSLRRELGEDMTLIMVAHRLQTVMDADKIMVLEAGQILRGIR